MDLFKPVSGGAFSVQSGKKYYLLRYPSHLSLSSIFPPGTTIHSLPSSTNRAFSKRRQVCQSVMTLTDSAPFSLYSAQDETLVQLDGMMAVSMESGGGKVAVSREEKEAAGAAVEASLLPPGRTIPQPDIIQRKRPVVADLAQETPTKKKQRSKKSKSVSKDE